VNSEKNSFDNSFEVFIADTPESKKLHYQLRYAVYAEEVGISFKALFQEQIETDEWDNCAVHFLVRHKKSGAWVGGLRLVFANDQVFPFQEWRHSYQKIDSCAQRYAVELSRLCIVNKPNITEAHKMQYDFKRQGKSVMWGLFRAAAVYSLHHNIEHWYFEMAPALAGLLTNAGFAVNAIGAANDPRGDRMPYHLHVENVLAHPFWQKDYKADYQLYSGLSADAFYKLVAGYLSFFQQNGQTSVHPIKTGDQTPA